MNEEPTRALPVPVPPRTEQPRTEPPRVDQSRVDQLSQIPAYGRVGPADPHADPATHPVLRPPDLDGPPTDPGMTPVPVVPEAPTVPTAQSPAPAPAPQAPTPAPPPVRREPAAWRTRTGGLAVGLVLSAVVLIFLLVFILQNLEPVRIVFLGFGGSLPIGVALLVAAVAGLLLVAIPGGVRVSQLRRAARRAARRE